MIRLKNYAFKKMSDPWKAPEQLPLVAVGNIYGHPDFKDGEYVETGSIKDSKGKIIKTAKDEILLESVDPKYLEFLESINYNFDPENPLTRID